MEVNSVRALMCNISVRVIHSFREGDFQFNYFGEIPTIGKRILNLDKAGTPHIRRSNQGS
ncbi:hypothetical protein H5410_017474 [Solanum commersonii]|uniref:Uncharacterized protein n=1 Tax=Solanum commersonii TaxID=4109 RepID=A0A9J6A034_SOLCO|nr:hypothetical protein H5410_017474 [Solanum commersonii]